MQKESPNPELESYIVRVEDASKDVFDHKSIRELWLHAWREFRARSLVHKIIYIFEYPFTLLRDISCPIVEDERWNKYWLLCTSFGATFAFCSFAGSTCGVCGSL